MAAIHPTRLSANLESQRSSFRKVVVVHAGARDAYQVALGLSEEGMLETLVTDLFWPEDHKWARALRARLPRLFRAVLGQRSQPQLPSFNVSLCIAVGLGTLMVEKLPFVPLGLRRRMTRYADATLGARAGRIAQRGNTDLLCYSYYGYDAFRHYRGEGTLFQLHPHPASMRRILSEELAAHPDCADSLRQEWELALPQEEFQHLVDETTMASRFFAASSFTRSTLVENGASLESICVIPYGVDSVRFAPDASRSKTLDGKLRLLFVGRINQRKGIKYMLEALRLINSGEVELTICGRVVDDLSIFKQFGVRVNIRPNVSAQELVAAYQAADLFVFPSVAEGFGQVLLESLSCGVPILSTTHTAAPDLVEPGRQGFIVEPRRADQLADRIEWALAHRKQLAAMGDEARVLAQTFTWRRFRANVASAMREAAFQRAPLSPSLGNLELAAEQRRHTNAV